MPGYLELKYISPVSNYNFNNENLHILVIVGTASNNKIKIYKVTIDDLDNINNTIRGYPIRKALLQMPFKFHSSLVAQLFCYNEKTKKIILLFSGLIHLDKFEAGNINYIEMNKTPPLELSYNKDEDFINEKFLKLEDRNTQDKAFLYLSVMPTTELPVMSPTIISYDDIENKNEIWVYSRYSNSVFKEFIPNGFSNTFKENTPKQTRLTLHTDYFVKNFIFNNDNYDGFTDMNKFYQKDNRFDIKMYNTNNTKIVLSRRMKSGLRPLRYEPYINNIITSPVDSRIKGFDINPTLKLVSGKKIYDVKNLVSKPFQYDGGSGFISRVTPRDYARVHMPYSGYLKEVGIFGGKDGEPYIVSLRFESSYFIPADVHERDLAAVIFGNFIHHGAGVGAGSRYWPELRLTQPDTYLIFNVIIIGQPFRDAFIFTNNKLKDMKKKVGNNKNIKSKPYWYEQGEELGKLTYGFSDVVYICNRPIQFASDVKYYSGMSSDESLYGKIDTYVKTKDIVGIMN